MTGIIHPYIYEIDTARLENRTLIRYAMPLDAYNAIKEAQGIPSDRAMDLGGLQAVLGWAAPSIDRVGISELPRTTTKTLTLLAIDPVKSPEEICQDIEVALSIWLGIVLPSKSSEISDLLTKGKSNKKNPCVVESIPTSLKWNGACANPDDPTLFDLISLIGARALEGQILNQETPDEGNLVLSGAQRSLYYGKSLLRFAPSRVDRKRSPGWWTELFNIAAISTPESRNLRLVINVSIRNFGEIHGSRLGRHHDRYADVFLPANAALAPGSDRIRCIEISTTRRDWWNAARGEVGQESKDRRVMKALLEMSGLKVDDVELGLKPVIGEIVSLYPRFGTVHGDQWAPGGTGVSHPEREEYLAFLDEHLGAAGFTRIKVDRVTKRGSREKLVTPIGKGQEDLQAAVSRRFGDTGATVCLLQSRPEGARLFHEAIRSVLGEPSSISEERWTFKSGLSLCVRHCPAGPFAQLLDAADESKMAGVKKQLHYKIKESIRQDRDKLARGNMTAYLNHALPSLPPGWMGLVEMNEALVEENTRDPYLLAYQTIAGNHGVAQVRLFNPEGLGVTNESEDQDSADPDVFAYQNSILDLFRSAGVSPVANQQIRLAAWWVINLNDRPGERQAGAKGGFCTPAYIECDNGSISVSLMLPNFKPIRSTYSEAVRKLATGEVANLKFKKAHEQSTLMAQFFAEATPRDGRRTVLFVETTNIRKVIPGISNSGGFAFDRLPLGNVGGAAPVREILSSEGLSIVRITNETAKAPSYWVELNTQGTTAGIFQEPNANRTYWISRGLPTPLQISARLANKKSRHDQGAGQYKHRRFPSLSEVTIVVKNDLEDILTLVTLTRSLMQCHIATDEKTILPFPLHEGSLLSGAAR